jgi:hypothetical protein
MARNDRIRRGVTGGVDPDNLGQPTTRQRQRARRLYNARVRKINARKRERAKGINQERRTEAREKFQQLTRSPSIESTENLQRSLTDARDRLNQTNIGLDDQERGLGVSYGMGQFGADAASNPYSRAAMLQRSYNQNQRASINTMASRGQLYAGATQNQANANASNYGSAYDALSKDFGGRMSQIGVQRQSAQDAYSNAEESAYRKSIADAGRENPVTRENAPRMPKFEKFKPKYKPLRPPIRRPRPNRPQGPSGGVRP